MKFVCTVCGYIHEGDEPPAQCPVCKAPADKFKKMEEPAAAPAAAAAPAKGKLSLPPMACEHVVGSAKGLDPRVVKGLQDNFNGECCEVGMYLAMSRQAEPPTRSSATRSRRPTTPRASPSCSARS